MKKTILIVEDLEGIQLKIKNIIRPFYKVITSSNKKECCQALKNNSIDVVILDLGLPDADEFETLSHITENHPNIQTIVLTGLDILSKAKKAIDLGAKEYLLKDVLKENPKFLLKTIEKLLEIKSLKETNYAFSKTFTEEIFIPDHPLYKQIFDLALQAAKNKLSLLILGETGTGKEFLTKYIRNHLFSDRPVISINCSAICKSLSESELFGFEEGSFTDAKGNRVGKFELANDGILHLDEIGSMPYELQGKFLRVLEDKKIVRLGGSKNIPVNFYLISSTNVNLKDVMNKGEFRSDLFYRINGISLTMPSIREFPELLPQWINYFLVKNNEKYNVELKLSENQLSWLLTKSWDGNLRELNTEIQRIVSFHNKGVNYFDYELTFKSQNNDLFASNNEGLPGHIRNVEREFIKTALKDSAGNISEAAKALKMNRKTLHEKIKNYNISPKNV